MSERSEALIRYLVYGIQYLKVDYENKRLIYSGRKSKVKKKRTCHIPPDVNDLND